MLHGRLVTLRPHRSDDLDALYEIAAELDTWEQRSPRPPQMLTRERYVGDLERGSEDAVRFVIDVGGHVVGRCELFAIDDYAGNAAVGIALHASARGRGYGGDAVQVLVDFAFERRRMHRLWLEVLASNAAALACYRRAGFVEEGRRRDHAWVRGQWVDDIVMGLLEDGRPGRPTSTSPGP